MFSKIFFTSIFVSSVFAANPQVIEKLVKQRAYFSAIPELKEYIVSRQGNIGGSVEENLEEVIKVTGIKPFETLPEAMLQNARTNSVKYIVAKKYFKKGNFNESLKFASAVEPNSALYPFASHLKATSLNMMGKYTEAISEYKECKDATSAAIRSEKRAHRLKQLNYNHDYCVAGIARASFGAGKYLEADLQYLDIPKSSPVWPEILFEEAWNSYYLKNYNRTLGKLVTYKAPFFDFIFIPESEVLKALSYMKMCLYDDVKKTVDDFYSQMQSPAKELRSSILANGKNYDYYLKLIEDFERTGFHQNILTSSILRSVQKDPNYIELREDLNGAMNELQKARNEGNSSLAIEKVKNLKEVVSTYLNLIGGFVRSKLVGKYAEVYRSFQSMSYMKLEILQLRKERLYKTGTFEQKKRGDVRYIDRNDKQYFWTFNGEFWADELGDYVFALGSEC